jgi:prepilin-type N-terminal cleavage/methylation domain-containing protein
MVAQQDCRPWGGVRAAGFTLLEMMVVVAILGAVTLAATTYLISASDATSQEMTWSALELPGTRALSQLTGDLTDAVVFEPQPVGPGVGIDSSYIQVKHPADWMGGGDLTNEIEAGSVFGVRAPWGDEQGWTEYAFSVEEKLSEGEVGDINRDGDTNDTFVLGKITKMWHGDDTGTERSQNFLHNVVQVETGTGTYGGDVDGDGDNDPIFSMADGSIVLSVSLWLYGRDNRGEPVLHNASSQVAMRNQN